MHDLVAVPDSVPGRRRLPRLVVEWKIVAIGSAFTSASIRHTDATVIGDNGRWEAG
jgi:hypothetical protein